MTELSKIDTGVAGSGFAGLPYEARLLGNLLLHSPELSPDGTRQDPELEFLMSCPGFCLVVCAVAYRSPVSRTMQQMALQQEYAYGILARTLQQGAKDSFACMITELDNQLAVLLIPREEQDESAFCAWLEDCLGDTLEELAHKDNVPVHTAYCVQRELNRISHCYGLMKNGLVYFDYIQAETGSLNRIAEPEPREHIGLWNRMENSAARVVDAFLEGNVEAAVTEVQEIVAVITDWIPPATNNLLADVQYYFDLLSNRLSVQYDRDVFRGLSMTEVIFESVSLRQLTENLTKAVHTMFKNTRGRTTDETFRFYQRVRDYMEDNIRDYNLSARSIAARFKISPQLLSIQFKKCYGITPAHYIEQKRVALIQEALVNTELSVESICLGVGMGSVSTLHRVFRKHCDMSPGSYRKNEKTNNGKA